MEKNCQNIGQNLHGFALTKIYLASFTVQYQSVTEKLYWGYSFSCAYLILSKLEEEVGGVSTRGEKKDEGEATVGVSVGAGQVKWWWLNVCLPQQVCRIITQIYILLLISQLT